MFHQYFFPFTEGFSFAKAGDLDSLKDKLDGSVCAVLLECVQGEGGVVALDKAYVQAVQALCREKDVLLLVDEVQTGAGRTGTFLACEQLGLQPDVVTMAKGLAAACPSGRACARRRSAALCPPGCMAPPSGATRWRAPPAGTCSPG